MNQTFNAVIIGAGNIGSRHAQALMHLGKDIELTIFDVNQASLELCKSRVEEISRGAYKTTVSYISDLEKLPSKSHMAILSTSSEHRLNSLRELTSRCETECIILEKFLFPIKSDYEKAQTIVQQSSSLFYVNCVKRQFGAYQFLKSKLNALEGPTQIEVRGNNWGLAGNAVHYIDLFNYLTDRKPETIEFLDSPFTEVIESKRNGYIELLGACITKTNEKDQITIYSSPGDYDKIECLIKKGGQTFSVIEYSGTIETFVDGEKQTFNYPFQSALTLAYANEFLATKRLTLTDYETGASYHLKFLEAMTHFIEKRNYKKSWKIT